MATARLDRRHSFHLGWLLAVAGATCWLSACSSSGPPVDVGRATQPVLGGTAAKAGDFPAAVALFVNSSSTFCSGVLVAPKLVLTAAHCFDPASVGLADLTAVTNATSAFVGVTDFNAVTGAGAAVARISRHPNYDGATLVHDLALLELAAPATAVPAVINADSALLPDGTSLTLVGYGVSKLFGGAPDLNSPGQLWSASVTTSDCSGLATDPTTSLCFDQSGGAGSCYDAGGPSFLDVGGTPEVVGIHSFGAQDCLASVDVRVDKELSFIAPLLCAADGHCVAVCGTHSLVADPDCTRAVDAGVSPDAGAGGTPDSGVAGHAGGGVGGTGTGGTTGGGGGTKAGSDSGTPPAMGAERGACYGNGSCNSGLVCLSSVCVREADAGGAAPATSKADSGCGCRLEVQRSPGDRPLAGALVLAFGALVASRRVRRSRR